MRNFAYTLFWAQFVDDGDGAVVEDLLRGPWRRQTDQVIRVLINYAFKMGRRVAGFIGHVPAHFSTVFDRLLQVLFHTGKTLTTGGKVLAQ